MDVIDPPAEQAVQALRRRLSTAGQAVADQVPTIQDQLNVLCSLLTEDLGIVGCTVTVVVSEEVQAVAARSSEDILVVDAVGFDTGEGPTFDAFVTRRPVLIAELSKSAARWPGYVPGMLAHGIGSVNAFPLQLGAIRLGVLTSYWRTARSMPVAAVSTCSVYGSVMTETLLRDGTELTRQDDIDELSSGARIRLEVYQAQGMIMVAHGSNLTDALARLRAAAFAAEVPLNDFAVDVVAGRRPSDLGDDGDDR